MKLKDVVFWGFTAAEMEQIRAAGGDGEKEYTIGFGQKVSDLIGADILTMITPGGNVSLFKSKGGLI